ncbi:helix-turn-helix domain-containing protein [Ningiella sp. W23]|uniref:helix-turn-helix domain-containing protein n=1 Tax=Ningiella sp. W23 TaxID=3023715 RepID=UPI00375772CE
MSQNTVINRFEWSNINSVITQLFDPHRDSQWRFTSDFGSADIYQFANDILSGRIEFYQLKSDLCLIVMDCEWHQDQTIILRDYDWIRFNFSLSINVDMSISQDSSIQALSPSWRIINNPPHAEIAEELKQDTKSIWATLCCKPSLIEEITNLNIDNMPELLQAALNAYSIDSFHRFFHFSQELNKMTNDLIHNELKGPMRIALMKAKCLEILCKSINEIQKLRLQERHVKLNEFDQAAIKRAHSILLEHFQSPPTVAELAKDVGVNRNKLFYGFKEVYGLGISDLVQDKKLELGYQMLSQSNISIQEVANLVGFKYQCNFSTAIKKKFGCSPSQIRANT